MKEDQFRPTDPASFDAGRALDRALWNRVTGVERSYPDPDANLLATYLDGRLSDEESETVEGLIAGSPDWCSALLSARADPIALPDHIASAVKNMAEPRVSWWAITWQGFGWSELAAAATIAVLAPIAAGSSFLLGQLTYENISNQSSGEFEIVASLDAEDGTYLLLSDPLLTGVSGQLGVGPNDGISGWEG
jgi:hypothetical protein